jgi:hypothetical protein
MVIIWMDTSRGITKKEFQEVLTVDFHAGITGEFYSNLFNFEKNMDSHRFFGGVPVEYLFIFFIVTFLFVLCVFLLLFFVVFFVAFF